MECPSDFEKWFRHEKKPLFDFQTRFFHGKNGRPIFKNRFVMRKNHFSVFIRGFFMEKMAVQISKMVLSREKRAFQISMVVFSWEKGFLIFETDFRHSVFRLPWNKTKRLLLKNSPKNNYTRPSHEYFLQDGVYIFHVWPSFGEKAYSAWFCFSMWEILRYSEMFIPVRFLR